jgi:perosamine synthetase
MNNQQRIHQVQPHITNQDVEEVNNYLTSGGWITEHKVTKNFEKLVSNKVNRAFAHAVPNGTIALYLALLGSGIRKGHRVAVPNLTMIASINSIIWSGAEPVLIDVNADMCMSFESLLSIKKPDAVMYVPLNGRTKDGLKIAEWCKQNNIVFIEDSAHALGSQYENEQNCGSLGDVSIFSFTPHKIITTGQGGMVLTNNEEIYEKINALKTFNRKKDMLDWHEEYGLNFKFTDLQASLGLSQLKRLDEHISMKLKILDFYSKISSSFASLGKFKDHEVPWFFDLEINSVQNVEKIVNLLEEHNVETRNLYPALSMQTYLKNVERAELKFSENIFNNIIWLPSSVNLNEDEINFIVEKINSIGK